MKKTVSPFTFSRPSSSNANLKGAMRLLRHCISLQKGDQLALIFDETTHETARYLIYGSAALEAAVAPIFVPEALQRSIGLNETTLPTGLAAALSDSSHTITCVTDAYACTSFRSKIFQLIHRRPIRIGHMPGPTPSLLRAASMIDFPAQSERCKQLCLPLIHGQTAKITSYTHKGEPHELILGLGAWKRLPVPSDAIIQPGSWGNVPGGEAYISPIENTAYGSFVVNASIPGHRMQRGEELVLKFESGRLMNFDSNSESAMKTLRRWRSYARLQKDPNWSNLAELGIGATPEIRKFTGHPLNDEKVQSSIHIAIGKSTGFGGIIDSTIHVDMVSKEPSLEVDGHSLMCNGEFTHDSGPWQYDWRTFTDTDTSKVLSKVQLLSVPTDIQDSRLHRPWTPGPQRSDWLQVGNEESSQLAARVVKCLESENSVPIEKVAADTHLPLSQCCAVILLLEKYELVSVEAA